MYCWSDVPNVLSLLLFGVWCCFQSNCTEVACRYTGGMCCMSSSVGIQMYNYAKHIHIHLQV
jgi:hypothetical protein